MASVIEAPRVICTKCVRIVRVHFFDLHFADDTMTIATECCERIFGFIDGSTIHGKRYQSDKSFTTADIVRMSDDEVEGYAKSWDERAAKGMARAKWSRWSKERP